VHERFRAEAGGAPAPLVTTLGGLERTLFLLRDGDDQPVLFVNLPLHGVILLLSLSALRRCNSDRGTPLGRRRFKRLSRSVVEEHRTCLDGQARFPPTSRRH